MPARGMEVHAEVSVQAAPACPSCTIVPLSPHSPEASCSFEAVPQLSARTCPCNLLSPAHSFNGRLDSYDMEPVQHDYDMEPDLPALNMPTDVCLDSGGNLSDVESPHWGSRRESRGSRQVTPQSVCSSMLHTSTQESMHRVTTIEELELLRGARVHNVMAGFGATFKESSGSSASYAMSEMVTTIDDFISHSWVTGRWIKFLTLALHYNLRAAMLAAWVAGVLVSLLSLGGVIPVLMFPFAQNMYFTAWLTGHVVFVFVLCFGQELRGLFSCFCSREPVVFLDKICISQVDKEVQMKGIQSLAGFLRVSRNLLVVYSDVYLRRLWTVYELASFLSLHQDCSRIVLLPTWQPIPIAGMMLGLAFTSIFVHFRLDYFTGVPIYSLLWALNTGSCAFVIRRWNKYMRDIEQTIESFSIRHAAVAVEADRAIIEGNVTTFMRYIGRVPPDTTEGEALDAFDAMVRKELPSSLRYSFGPHAFPYLTILASSMTFFLVALDQATWFLLNDAPVAAASRLIYRISVSWAMCPVFLVLITKIVVTNLHFTGTKEGLYFVAILFFAVYPVSFWWSPAYFLDWLVRYYVRERAWGKAAGALAGLFCFCCLTFVLGYWLYTQPKRPLNGFDIDADSPVCDDEVPQESGQRETFSV